MLWTLTTKGRQRMAQTCERVDTAMSLGSGSMFEGHREVTSITCYKKYNITPACVTEFFVKIPYNAEKNHITSRYTNSYSAVPFIQCDSPSIGTTAHCGLCLVEQSPSIFSYLPPTLSTISLPALEDLFLLPLSILSWVFPFLSTFPVLEWRSFWASYSRPFSLGDLTSFILCPFIHFTIFSPLRISSSSRLVWLFHSPFSYLGRHILLNIFLSKISRAFQ